MNPTSLLPDVASLNVSDIAIDQVGMSDISLPIPFEVDQQTITTPTKVSIRANVKNHQKGLHMSRMYQSLQALTQHSLTPVTLKESLQSALEQQKEVNSDCIFCDIETEVLRKRSALHTQQYGWNRYPVKVSARFDHQTGITVSLRVTVTYSSSCPASAALSRKALKEVFLDQFHYEPSKVDKQQIAQWLEQQGTYAIPHSQRSEADITVDVTGTEFPIESLIDLCERALGTPVQTFVKRQDEQQFAINNGQNPMFVEDASRRLMQALTDNGYSGHLAISHYESLHGHNAVAQSSFGHKDT